MMNVLNENASCDKALESEKKIERIRQIIKVGKFIKVC